MRELTLKKRLLLYMLLAALCFIIPYAITLALFKITNDSDLALKISWMPIYLIIHYGFGAFFLDTKPAVKFTVPALAAFVSLLLLKISRLAFLLISALHIPAYFAGGTGLMITSIFTWEILYHVLMRLMRNVPVD